MFKYVHAVQFQVPPPLPPQPCCPWIDETDITWFEDEDEEEDEEFPAKAAV